MQGNLLLVVAGAVFAFALISGRLHESPLTPPIVFAALGLLAGPACAGLIEVDLGNHAIHTLGEITLVFVLFTDAARIDVRRLSREFGLPVRLLAVGMPLSIALGTVVALAVFNTISFWEAALAAAILAPTDAALGQAVVSSDRVPVRVRQTLNVESGLNDGIAVPAILVLLALAGGGEGEPSSGGAVVFTLRQLVFGPVAGVGVALVGGRALATAHARGWMSETFRQISVLALSLIAVGVAESLGGNPFIAAFTAGLTLGATLPDTCQCLYEFTEEEGQFLTLLTFLIFGVAIGGPLLTRIDARLLVYAVLSLTVVRMVPVLIALVGSGLRPTSKLFIGWFGPRGLASILFALLVMEESLIVGHATVFDIVMTTVLLSIFAHGLTAALGVRVYARSLQTGVSSDGREPVYEHQPMREFPVRVRFEGQVEQARRGVGV